MNPAQRCEIEVLANETIAYAKRAKSLVVAVGDQIGARNLDKVQELLTQANYAADMALKYASGTLSTGCLNEDKGKEV